MIDELRLARYGKLCLGQARVSAAMPLELIEEVKRLHQEIQRLNAEVVQGATAFNGGLRLGRDETGTRPVLLLDLGTLPGDLFIRIVEPAGPDPAAVRPGYQLDTTTLLIACRLFQADVRRRAELVAAAVTEEARALEEGAGEAPAAPARALADASLPSRLLGGPASGESGAPMAPMEVP